MPTRFGRAVDLDPDDRARLEDLYSAADLSELVRMTDAESRHEAYFDVKPEWADLVERGLSPAPAGGGLPGDCVHVDGTLFSVHGITHADTRAERRFVRRHVDRLLDEDAAVYCEQGIRSMYFSDRPEVCGMDDYSWARKRCEELAIDARIADLSEPTFDGLDEDLDTLVSRFREAVFSLIESNSGLYGEEFAEALGDVASEFLVSHEDMATGGDFEAFARTRRASEDPGALRDLQDYYTRTFLPQPLEREWLRRHDRELEVVTHARNERMADYAVYHGDDRRPFHLIVGAAHHPGVLYYLESHRDGGRRLDGFEPIG